MIDRALRPCRARNRFVCTYHGQVQLPDLYETDPLVLDMAVLHAGLSEADRAAAGVCDAVMPGLDAAGVLRDATVLGVLTRDGERLYGIRSEMFRLGLEAQCNPRVLRGELAATTLTRGNAAGAALARQLLRWLDGLDTRVTAARAYYTDNPDHYVTEGPMPVPDDAGRTSGYRVPTIQQLALPDLRDPAVVSRLLGGTPAGMDTPGSDAE